MHPFRLLILGGVGFASASMLLPFASFPVVGPVAGVSADAWPALLPLVPLALLALDRRWDRGFDASPAVTAVVLSAASLVFAVVKLGDAFAAVRAAPGASLGPGAWVLVAATGVVAVGCGIGVFVRR